jgi:myo-inositol 2-dehydrogenase/D-chiro-inositol 1-dehydrogenase
MNATLRAAFPLNPLKPNPASEARRPRNAMNQDKTNHDSKSTRRSFLKTSGVAVGGATLASTLAFPGVNFGAPDSRKLKIGWVGLGGRGTGAIDQAMKADSNLELYAMADVFEDKVEAAEAKVKTMHPNAYNVGARKFTGLDGFNKVLDSGVDVVLLTTSPGFRPQHIAAAVEAGVHVFAEKPMATDAPGARSVRESIKKAREKGTALVDGFVWRWTYAQRDTYERILGGEIGDIRTIYSAYNGNARKRYPTWGKHNTKTDLEYQIRRWYYFTWLSGDHCVEYAIASGGRQVRTGEEFGNIFDHFAIEYHWANGVDGYHYSRQQDNTEGGVNDRIYGTKGVYTGESGRKHHTLIGDDLKWRWKGASNNGYQTEHDEMYASIRAGNPINTGDRMINTTMTAIMGRMAAYTGKKITWDMAWNSQEKLVPDNIKWDMDLPVRPVRMPGKTEFI